MTSLSAIGFASLLVFTLGFLGLALSSVLTLVFAIRGITPSTRTLLIASWLISLAAVILPIHISHYIEASRISQYLPQLDDVARRHAQAPFGSSLEALLAQVALPTHTAATHLDLHLTERSDSQWLIVDGTSWGTSYRFNTQTCCWERWEEDYVANARVHCLSERIAP